MNYTINSHITPRAATQLLITDEIDLLTSWRTEQAICVLDEVRKLSTIDLLRIIDFNTCCPNINPSNVPQFGKIDTVIRIPQIMLHEKVNNLDYIQLGFMLKKDPYASLNSNQKYGENHGKVAAQIGLINCISNRFVPSTLTEIFAREYKFDDQLDLAAKLFARIPIIQILVREAKYGKIDGYQCMSCLKESTKERRGTSIKAILELYKKFGNCEMNRRINNIIWDK